jgi:hypothetical protein
MQEEGESGAECKKGAEVVLSARKGRKWRRVQERGGSGAGCKTEDGSGAKFKKYGSRGSWCKTEGWEWCRMHESGGKWSRVRESGRSGVGCARWGATEREKEMHGKERRCKLQDAKKVKGGKTETRVSVSGRSDFDKARISLWLNLVDSSGLMYRNSYLKAVKIMKSGVVSLRVTAVDRAVVPLATLLLPLLRKETLQGNQRVEGGAGAWFLPHHLHLLLLLLGTWNNSQSALMPCRGGVEGVEANKFAAYIDDK